MICVRFKRNAVQETHNLLMAQAKAPHSNSEVSQFFSLGSVVWLMYNKRRNFPSGCFCSNDAPKPSLNASVTSWNFREPSIAAWKSENARTSELTNCFETFFTIAVWCAVNSKRTSLRNRECKSLTVVDKPGNKISGTIRHPKENAILLSWMAWAFSTSRLFSWDPDVTRMALRNEQEIVPRTHL